MRRGDVYWANLTPRSGSEQRGRRPVVVISDDTFNINERWMSVIVVPLSTSENQLRRGPTAVLIPSGVSGLPRDSVALCHQVTTLDRTKLDQLLGVLPAAILQRIEAGLKVALSLP